MLIIPRYTVCSYITTLTLNRSLLINFEYDSSSYIFFCRKSAFKEKIHMVHLNLAIALLCGLIVFVCGVETAIENEVK